MTDNSAVTDPGQAPATDPQNVDSLPEWAREKLTKANNEAARYRTEKNDAVATAKAEVTAEYERKLAEAQSAFTELETKLSVRELELLKLSIAIDADVPSKKAKAFAAILSGTTEDEVTESAKQAKSLFGAMDNSVPATDPTQGSGGSHIPLNGDPILAAIKAAVRA